MGARKKKLFLPPPPPLPLKNASFFSGYKKKMHKMFWNIFKFFFPFRTKVFFLQNYPFQAFLGSKTYIFIIYTLKIKLALHRASGNCSGAGVMASADASTKNASCFFTFSLKLCLRWPAATRVLCVLSSKSIFFIRTLKVINKVTFPVKEGRYPFLSWKSQYNRTKETKFNLKVLSDSLFEIKLIL